MTPEELAEALQIARATTEDMAYSRRVLARAVLHSRNVLTRARELDLLMDAAITGSDSEKYESEIESIHAEIDAIIVDDK